MKVKVQKINGEAVLIEVQRTERIIDIKKKIEEKTGMAPDGQKLIFENEILNDDNITLNNTSLKEESVIELLASNSMKIYVESFPFEASKTERIIDLKKKIAEKIKKKPEEQVLFFQGFYLKNNSLVGDYRITDQSVIDVRPKLKNGIVIFIYSTDNVVVTYQVLKAERISDLKRMINKSYKVLPDQQKLTYNGELLEDNLTFDESKLGEESEIHINAPLGGKIRVFVKTMDGKVFALEVHKYDRIIDLKKRIEEKSGFAYDDQNLYYDGGSLENDKCVNDYKIKEESVISALARLKGGMVLSDPEINGKCNI